MKRLVFTVIKYTESRNYLLHSNAIFRPLMILFTKIIRLYRQYLRHTLWFFFTRTSNFGAEAERSYIFFAI